MTTQGTGPRATAISISDDELTVNLADGRALVVPLEWFSKLSDASQAQLEKFEIVEDGREIHWPALGEEINVSGLLRGIAALDGN
jgi:hypothetical protein